MQGFIQAANIPDPQGSAKTKDEKSKFYFQVFLSKLTHKCDLIYNLRITF